MGKKYRELVEVDKKELIADLNRAYCDEWLAFYSYWYMAQIVSGPGYEDMGEFLKKIANDELEHAGEVADLIIKLGGMPTANPMELEKNANAPYPGFPKKTDDYDKIIKLVMDAEAGAIEVYNKIAKKVMGKDHNAHQLVTHILSEEVTHEEIFENLLSSK
jgi:bacterioferritin